MDGCNIPECLRDINRINVQDPSDCASEIDRIVRAIHGQYDKPPVQNPPTYTQLEVLQIDGLCRNDAIFLEEACHVALENGYPNIVDVESFERRLLEKDMPLQDILDAQDFLANRFYIQFERTFGGPRLEPFRIETAGFSAFAEAGGVPDYNPRFMEVARFIVEHIGSGVVENTSIERELKVSPMLVEHILERLRDAGQIEYGHSYGGRLYMYVHKVSPELRRKIEFMK
ncbi:MAG TPA: hypothetical protein VHU83_16350 [Bryobacteraceae bacterium]|nr:hypothetical protein [Bryobacteraceae bacterium]